jgi:exodeoxyribonuclease VII small subunit
MSAKPPAAPSAPATASPAFEVAVKRLGEIVSSLEGGELSLEDALRLFEEGVKLSRISQEKLDAAQKKVEELLGVDEQGRPRTQPFDAGEDDEDR